MNKMERKSLLIRALCIAVLMMRGEGHLGSCLSVVEILTALYWDFLRIDPDEPHWPDRDRFLLSKAHASLAYYAALSLRGFFSPNWLWDFNSLGSNLPLEPHPDKCPGVDLPTGPLGTGLAKGVGMAVAAKMHGRSSHVVVLTGDGEMQKGQIWEAVAYAGHAGLDNLKLIVDANGRQLDGAVSEISSFDIPQALRAFGWVVMTVDGHSIDSLTSALRNSRHKLSPFALVARTVKGKGIPVIENDLQHHYFRTHEVEIELPPDIKQEVDNIWNHRAHLEDYLSHVQ